MVDNSSDLQMIRIVQVILQEREYAPVLLQLGVTDDCNNA
jgi:hypothetical protein